MFLQVLFPALFNKELMETFRWRELQIEEIEETEETLPSSSKGPAEDKWIALNWERLEVGEVALTVLKPSGPTSDPLVALKIKLGKVVFPFKVALAATVNMFPPIANTDAVELNDFLSASPQQRAFGESKRRSRRTDPYPAHIGVLGNDRSQAASLDDRPPADFLRTV